MSALIHVTEQNHVSADDLFMAMKMIGGPDLREYLVHRWGKHDTVYVEAPDWQYMNEFMMREEQDWWFYFMQITGMQPGEGCYIDF